MGYSNSIITFSHFNVVRIIICWYLFETLFIKKDDPIYQEMRPPELNHILLPKLFIKTLFENVFGG
jgi:hypothetical protein